MIDSAELTLIGLNLVAGLGCAVPLARRLAGVSSRPVSAVRCYWMMIGLYVIECVALIVGMGIPVFSVGLALVWGVVLGRLLRSRATPSAGPRVSFYLSLYSSLPAASFLALPALLLANGWDVVSVAGGARLGIPGFLPWPVNTVLGFYASCALGAVTLKLALTTALARWVMTRRPGTASA